MKILIYIRYYYFRLFDNSLGGLQRFLNSIPNINEGGCGLAAYILHLYSDKRGKVVGYHCPGDSSKDDLMASSHCYFKLGPLYYDSTGVYRKKDILHCNWANSSSLYTYTPDQIYNSVRCYYIWNKSFRYRELLLKLFKIN